MRTHRSIHFLLPLRIAWPGPVCLSPSYLRACDCPGSQLTFAFPFLFPALHHLGTASGCAGGRQHQRLRLGFPANPARLRGQPKRDRLLAAVVIGDIVFKIEGIESCNTPAVPFLISRKPGVEKEREARVSDCGGMSTMPCRCQCIIPNLDPQVDRLLFQYRQASARKAGCSCSPGPHTQAPPHPAPGFHAGSALAAALPVLEGLFRKLCSPVALRITPLVESVSAKGEMRGEGKGLLGQPFSHA